MNKSIKSFSLFFPMYNEKGYIEKMVAKAKKVVSELTDDYEILIIDDCSRDGSEKIADQLAAADPHIRVIHHKQNQGYGGALRTGFTNASKDLVFYTDCDEPVDLEKIKEEISKMQHCDVLAGYRVPGHTRLRRIVYSTIYNFLIRHLFGVKVRDVNFSFKIIRQAVLRDAELTAKSVFIDGELLAEAVRCGYKVIDTPIHYTPRTQGASSFDKLSAATDTLKEIIAYFVRQQRRRRAATCVRDQATPTPMKTRRAGAAGRKWT